MIACTATATSKVIDDIKKVLHLQSSPCFIGSFDRPNIFYKVFYKDVIDAENVEGAQGHLVSFIKKQHKRCEQTNSKCSGIVYCHTRVETNDLAKAIQKCTSIVTVAYHGGLKDNDRNKVQQSWTSGESQIAVATVAFGMGIDLSHVRYVVHWNLAKSPESFYQESGRAGRDGLPAYSVLYYSKSDASKFHFLLSQRTSKGSVPQRELSGLDSMIRYCTTPACRRFILLQHFGEKMDNPTELCDGSCDFCVNPSQVKNAIEASSASNEFKFYSRRPHLKVDEKDDHFDDESVSGEVNTEWDVDGLGINGFLDQNDTTQLGVGVAGYVDDTTFSSTGKNSKAAYEKASGILAKYEAVETKSAGFVNFKVKKDKETKANEDLRIPAHLIPLTTLSGPQSADVRVQARSSADYADEANQLREEISKAKAEIEARRNKYVNR
jgi:superfamily II DNA helicase RecQ